MLSTTSRRIASQENVSPQFESTPEVDIAGVGERCHDVLFKFIPRYLSRDDRCHFTATCVYLFIRRFEIETPFLSIASEENLAQFLISRKHFPKKRTQENRLRVREDFSKIVDFSFRMRWGYSELTLLLLIAALPQVRRLEVISHELNDNTCTQTLLTQFFREVATSWLNIRILRYTDQHYNQNCNRKKNTSYIPAEIGLLTRLQCLELKQLTLQALPVEIGQLTCLVKLSLNHFPELETLPNTLGCLSLLQELTLIRLHRLDTLPAEFGQLSALKKLTISQCDALKSLPDEFGRLSGLEDVALTNLRLAALPTTFGQLSALKKLVLSQCSQLKNLPDEFGQLSGLEDVLLEALSLGALPASFGQLSALKKMKLVSSSWANPSKMNSLPDEFGGLSRLEDLTLAGLDLEALPLAVGQLHALTRLKLQRLYKLKQLPDAFERLTGLVSLKLADLTIPSLPFNLNQLQHLSRLKLTNIQGLTTLQLNFVGHTQPCQVFLQQLDDLTKVSLIDQVPNRLAKLTCINLKKVEFEFG